MAVQQRRTSKTRKNKRRTHYKLSAPTLVKCSSCGEMKRPHHACPNCGSTKDEKSASATTEKKPAAKKTASKKTTKKTEE